MQNHLVEGDAPQQKKCSIVVYGWFCLNSQSLEAFMNKL